jgi:hypothetical protein
MSWREHHERSERLAADAELAILRGELSLGYQLYNEAAQEEVLGLESLDSSKTRTRGITAVSAASLYYKAHELGLAESLAHRFMGQASLPEFAIEGLRGLLQSIWSEEVRQRTGLKFAPGEVIVAVKGGEIIEGGAPLDLILQKVQIVQSLFYRTAELLRGLPHRTRGRPSREIQESFRPWLFQTAPGSYQFAVAVEEPAQASLFETGLPTPEALAGEFLRIVRATVEAPEQELPEIVPDPAYRSTILKLTRNLAPTGRKFSQLDIRGSVGEVISLVPETRTTVTEVIRSSPLPLPDDGQREAIRGVLRALHLDQDWIEVTVADEHIRIDRVGETVDDVIGPMVNHGVTVQVSRDARGRRHFLDIEAEE